jgi:hypothetical protein
MFCPKCGAADQYGLDCRNCNTPLVMPPPMVPIRTSGMAIAGFVCAFLCSILGLILSWMALDEIKKSDGTLGGEGLARAGMWLSVIFMILGGLALGVRS